MARKTFISYKYSEASELRDKLINSLGVDATFYKGETSKSPDLTDTSTDNIKEKLKAMIHDTSVTIVIISPKINESTWIDWEIEYSLKEISREGRTSRANGIVGVISKIEGSYNWLKSSTKMEDGCTVWNYNPSILFPIIIANRYNLKSDNRYTCPNCKCFDMLNGSYISLIEEDDFLKNPQKYIENAFEKSNDIENYNISKLR